MTTGDEDVSVSMSGPVSVDDASTKHADNKFNRNVVLPPPSLSLSESTTVSDLDSTQGPAQRSTAFVGSSIHSEKKSSALLSPPKSPLASEATDKTGQYQQIVSVPNPVPLLTPLKSQDAVEPADMQPVCTPSRKPCRRSASKTSPFFPKVVTSCIPFPCLRSPSFGLIQEKLSHDPYRLLIAVIFLNKTKGQAAVPVFWKVMERYPTPMDLAGAEQVELVEMIGHLGLQNQRAATCINLSKKWIEQVPCKGVRYRRLHYPKKDDGKDIQCNSPPIGDDDVRSAWEIAHLPGIGPYAIDSWRIFCRDKLRGLATGWNGEGAASRGFEPEWRRVLPRDKELRAFLRWMWLRHGWEWDSLTGRTTLASDDLILQATRGGTAHERGDGNWDLKPQGEVVAPVLNQARGDGDEEGQAVQIRGECVRDATERCNGG